MVSIKCFCKSVSGFVQTFVVENIMFSEYNPMYHELNLVTRFFLFFKFYFFNFQREKTPMVILTIKNKVDIFSFPQTSLNEKHTFRTGQMGD